MIRRRVHALPHALPSLLVATVLVPMAVAGCAEEEGNGSLVIPVVLGPDRDCSDVDVSQIRVSVAEEEFTNVVGCSDARPREVRLERVPAGRYEILVEGLDGEGVAVMDNLGDERRDRRVEVVGGASVEITPVTLTSAPALLEVTVDFRASTCAASGIDRFQIRAFDAQVDQLLSYDLDCDDRTLGTTLIPDEGRLLKGDRFADFTIAPLDRSGQAVGAPLGPDAPFEPPGPGRLVEVVLLDCDGNGCPELEIDIQGQ